MSDIKNYKEHWERTDDIASGGQGTTIKAISTQDRETISAVKILNKQNDAERRARMQRETVALSTLSHSGLPKVLDNNTEFWKDPDYKLFIATEFIPGDTLSNFDFSNFTLIEKAKFIINISEVINYCHQRGVVHRDIKPDNIIIKNNSISEPVILDFGISFNFNDIDDDNLTPDEQHLGNRFLILPEQKVGEVGKRDFRTDTTCIVGLFYFILTTQLPTIIIDEYNQNPHQRKSAKDIIDTFPKHQKDIINNIFDVGFNQLIDKRWQTVQSLIDQLEFLINAEPVLLNTEKEKIKHIKNKSSTQAVDESKSLMALLKEVDRYCNEAAIEVIQDLGNDWNYRQSGNLSSGLNYSNLFNIFNKYQQKLTTSTMIVAIFTGNELLIKLVETNDKLEVFRQPILSDINWLQFKENLKSHYINVIAGQF